MTHVLPAELPRLPKALSREFNHLVDSLDLPFVTFEAAELAYAQFFNPLLTCEDPGIWDPAVWGWKTGG